MKSLKKLLILALLIVSSLFNVQTVFAADFTTALSGPNAIESTAEFNVIIQIKNAKDLMATMGTLTYDKAKLSLVSSTGTSGFTATVGTNIVLDAASGKSGSFNIATLKFKPTANFKVGEKTTITLGAQSGGNASGSLSGTGSSLTISMNAPKSTNNYLKSLTLSEGNIKFSKKTTSYNLVVDNKIDKIVINSVAEDEKATINGNGTKSLKVYSNTFNIVVTSESGAKKTYKITVVRKDSDGNTQKLSTTNTLKSIEIKGYDIGFEKSITNYTLNIKNDVDDLEIIAKATDSNSKVTINKPEEFSVGENIITIEVESQSGEVNFYTINAIKEDIESEGNANINDSQNDIIEDSQSDSFDFKILWIIIVIVITIAVGSALVILKSKKQLKKN